MLDDEKKKWLNEWTRINVEIDWNTPLFLETNKNIMLKIYSLWIRDLLKNKYSISVGGKDYA
jgi:hypothetical protein|tara:strand:- start:6256 stop:6441 length:186 start_codon:yes stop_codon:yes gene_type:complete